MRIATAVGATCAALVGCSASRDTSTKATVARTAVDSVPVPVAAAPAPVPIARGPLTIDTLASSVLEVWPLRVSPEHQLDETRRIVELLQADLTLQPGFENAVLMASGDGSGLVLLAFWRDEGSAARADSALAAWLHAEPDSTVRRRRVGTATTRVHVRRTVGTPPAFTASAMLQFTRYAMKRGHSFGALASLADSNLAMRVLKDTAAQGGATFAASDSGALYMLVQARTATALDPNVHASGPLPFWAPFAEREEQLLAVVALIRHR